MSPKDLCTIGFIDDIIKSGVKVLKIEGRGRAPEYVKTVTECYREAADAFIEGTYTKQKIAEWDKKLASVYNRGFWDGYYLGQELGEWSDVHGSKATTRKKYIGKGVHYYPKVGIAEFKLETHSLKVGDKILITGPTTGVIETEIKELMVDEVYYNEIKKGVNFTTPLDTIIRNSDKLYVVEDLEEAQIGVQR